MTLKMPTDPSGTPSGFFDFLDPSQEVEVSLPDQAGVFADRSSSFDFIMGFETDLDSGFGTVVAGGEVPVESEARDTTRPPAGEIKPSVLVAPTVPKRTPSMPTIFEEDEEEEGEGDEDVTITPSPAQRALLPPDKFAVIPRSSPQPPGAAAVLERAGDHDPLCTPRPRGELLVRSPSMITFVADSPSTDQTSTFPAPTPHLFDPGFSLETCTKGSDSHEPQADSFDQFDFFSSLIIGNESSAMPDFDASFDFDFDNSAWGDAMFGESPSRESTPSSSSSLWESASKEESSMTMGAGAPSLGTGWGCDADMQLLFPSVDVGGFSTEDEFLKALMEAVQSTPKVVSWTCSPHRLSFS